MDKLIMLILRFMNKVKGLHSIRFKFYLIFKFFQYLISNITFITFNNASIFNHGQTRSTMFHHGQHGQPWLS